MHYASCDDPECRGCAPVDASRGFLCEAHWAQLQTALYGAGSDLASLSFRLSWAEWSGVVLAFGRLVSGEKINSGKPGSRLPLSQVMLDIDQADSYLVSLAEVGGDVEQWVRRQGNAVDAIAFTRASVKARRTHELAERDRKLNLSRWRCPNQVCAALNPDPFEMWVRNPKFAGDEGRFLECVRCGHVLSFDEAVRAAQLEIWANQIKEVV